MQRSPALQPLSREHHSALKLARVCERAALSADTAEVHQACRRVIQAYTDELETHFLFEEQRLLPLLCEKLDQPLVERTLAEHRQLYALLDDLKRNDANALARFGNYLTEHVRFEERELFPALEAKLEKQNQSK